MRRGRKPKPTEVKRRAGNPGKRRVNAAEPQPRISLPIPPEDLTDPASLKVWNERAALLSPLGLMTDADRAFVKRSCQVTAAADADHRALCHLGDFLSMLAPAKANDETWDGVEPKPKIAESAEEVAVRAGMLNVWFKLRREFRGTINQERLMLAELGMTPSARSRVGGDKLPQDPAAAADLAAAQPLRVIEGGKR